MVTKWLIVLFSATVLIAGCNSGEPKEVQNDDKTANPVSDTSILKNDVVDSVDVELSEQKPPDTIATKNIPDIKKVPVKPVVKKKGPVISFKEMVYSWGEIEQGEKITKAFTFKNVGDTPLNVFSATATCGCTMPSYPFLPIYPGKTGKIEVTYDSRLKAGQQEAKVTVQTDAYPKTYVLMLSGFVKEKPKTPNPPKDSAEIEG